jgi:hypothetical protein
VLGECCCADIKQDCVEHRRIKRPAGWFRCRA